MTATTRAVVLGASIAGLLAAQSLASHTDSVVLVERDRLPRDAASRRGVPQGHHAHLLWSSGARILESFLPGIGNELVAAGARRIGAQSDLVSLTAYGWQHRFPARQFMLVCSRPLLESVVRARVLANPAVRLLEGSEATALLGGPQRVTGVLLRDRDSGEERELAADITVDACGRGSRTAEQLVRLGLPEVRQDVVDTGLMYASRRFRVPPGAGNVPLVSVYADHRSDTPGQNGLVMPIEDDQWLVTLSGTRGGEPSGGEDGFVAFARSLRHPLVAELLADAEPLTEVRTSRSTVNRRLHYEWIPSWPHGLVVIGDAAAALNPVYGHGMTAAARTARVLDRLIRRHGLTDTFYGGVQKSVAEAAQDPWMLAVAQDLQYPGCRSDIVDEALSATGGRNQFVDLLGVAATRNSLVSAAYTEVASLSAPISSLQSPRILTALREGDLLPELTEPPLLEAESRSLRKGSPSW